MHFTDDFLEEMVKYTNYETKMKQKKKHQKDRSPAHYDDYDTSNSKEQFFC